MLLFSENFFFLLKQVYEEYALHMSWAMQTVNYLKSLPNKEKGKQSRIHKIETKHRCHSH